MCYVIYYVISFTFSRLSINSGKFVNLLGFLAFLILSVNSFVPLLKKAEGRNVTLLKSEQLEVCLMFHRRTLTYLSIYIYIQLFQKTLSKEKQTSHKPRPQGNMGSFKSVFIAAVKRELKKPRRRRRGQRLKMNLYFTYESRDTLKSFTMFISVQAITKLNLGHIDKSEIKI